MPKLSLEQMRSRSWSSREKAAQELRRSGIAERGDDYELRQYTPDSWQLMPLDEFDEVMPAEHSAATPAAPAKVRKGKAAGKSPADQADLDAIKAATAFDVSFRLSPTKTFAGAATSISKAVAIADAFDREHGKSGRRAMIYAVREGRASVPVPADLARELAGKESGPEPDPAPEPAPEPTERAPEPAPGTDLSLIDPGSGPFSFLIVAAEVRQNSPHLDALEVSKRIGRPVAICGRDGEVIRTISAAAIRAARKALPRTAREGGQAAGPRVSGKSADCAKLLFREGGATKAELMAVTEWGFGERYIHRIAATQKAVVETIGKDHWRLIKVGDLN